MTLKQELRGVLIELIKYQKIACSPKCDAKQGIEMISLDQALTELTPLFEPLERLEELNKLVLMAREIMTDALNDDRFNDHSSGCWQKEAKKFRNETRVIYNRFGRVKENIERTP